MKKLSTGQDSTLGNWYKMCAAFFGEKSAPTKFIKSKMDEQGEDTEVIAEEEQLLAALGKMYMNELENLDYGK